MKLITLTPNSFASNCYLVVHDAHAFVIDPSASTERILSALRTENAVCDGILLTHGHFDHMLSLDELRDALPSVPTYIHEADAENLSDGTKNAFSDFFGRQRAWRAADRLLHDGDILPLGSASLQVLHTPGHTKGSCCFLASEGEFLLSGDTMFAAGYGRYDLYGGDSHALAASLQRISTLPMTLTLASGHGETTTLERAWRALGRMI
ncbi:MAG: MBL fold metallo-hydrolase [Clostridia bacterium]|nr:MBL fold metallo-hydrolase [Clostridia bacterium]